MKASKLTQKKRQIKEVTLMIDSKILQQQPSPKSNLQKTLRRPLSTISMSMNLKPKDFTMKTPTTLNLNSTIKRQKHSKSKSQDKKSHALQRSKSLTSISNSPHTKSISFVSKQSNMKCFEKLVFKITDFFEKEKYVWKLNKLSYQIVMKVLCQLHYIQYSTEKQLVENNLMEVLKKVYQFWLNLSSKSYATLKNLIFLICSFENIVVQLDYIESALISFRNHLERRRGKLTDVPEYIPQYRFLGLPILTQWNYQGDLIISKNSSWKIQQCFNLFKTNRLNYNSRNSAEIEVEKFSVSQKSNQLALSKRQKIEAIIKNRKPNIQKISLEDILNFKEDIVCNPPLSARTYDESKSTETKPVKRHRLKIHRKCEPLIEMLSQPKVIKIRSKQQLQFERNKQQCTFKPDINPLKVNQTQNLLKIKNVVKTLERMKNTRESKIEELQFRQTGWTNNHRRSRSKDRQEQINGLPLSARRYQKQNSYEMQCKKEKQILFNKRQQIFKNGNNRQEVIEVTEVKEQIKGQPKSENKQSKTDIKIPLLFIDINIDETQKQRLVIYQQDNSLQLAASFAKKHNLSKEMEIKLKELLDYQMNSILTKIEEEAEQEDIF